MNKKDLERVLKDHKEWVKDNTKGIRADLSGADLSGADLFGVYIKKSDIPTFLTALEIKISK